MSDSFSPKDNNLQYPKVQQISQFSNGGLHIKQDDQDWGSAGMNDIDEDSE